MILLRPRFFSRLGLDPKIPLWWRSSKDIRLYLKGCCCVLKFPERVNYPKSLCTMRLFVELLHVWSFPRPKISSVSQAKEQLQAARRKLFTQTIYRGKMVTGIYQLFRWENVVWVTGTRNHKQKLGILPLWSPSQETTDHFQNQVKRGK